MNGKEVMTLLLDRRGVEVVTTEEVVKVAATCGQNDVLDLLSAYDLIPIGEQWRRIAMFHNAAGTGDASYIAHLLHGGIEPKMENIRMATPLWIAAANGHEAVVKILAQRSDVRVNLMSESRRTPLFRPSSYCYEAVVIILMEAGADANIMDENGDTPVTVVRRNGHERIAKILEGGIR